MSLTLNVCFGDIIARFFFAGVGVRLHAKGEYLLIWVDEKRYLIRCNETIALSR
jgi:hypothetical protein